MFLSFLCSPCSPRAPNLLHVLPSGMVGWNDFCTNDWHIARFVKFISVWDQFSGLCLNFQPATELYVTNGCLRALDSLKQINRWSRVWNIARIANAYTLLKGFYELWDCLSWVSWDEIGWVGVSWVNWVSWGKFGEVGKKDCRFAQRLRMWLTHCLWVTGCLPAVVMANGDMQHCTVLAFLTTPRFLNVFV